MLKPELSIIVFTHDYKPAFGGIPEHSHKIALHFAKRGAKVLVVTRHYRGDQFVDGQDPFETVRVSWFPFLGHLSYLIAILKILRGRRVDMVYCANSYPCGLVMRIVKMLKGTRFGVAIHGHEVMYGSYNLRQKIKKSFKTLQIWALINGADRIFAVSDFTAAAAIAAGAERSKIRVIYNGVNLEEIESTRADASLLERLGIGQKRLVLSVGRLEWHKGFDMVMRAVPRVIGEVPDVVFVVVGDGEIRGQLEQIRDQLKLGEKVIFAGKLPRREMLSLMKSCDVFVLASRQEKTSVEGFGIVFLEAGACGKPVVGGRSGGIPDAVVDGVTGLLVDPNDPEEIAKAIIKILCDRELAKTLGRNGQERVRREFTWDKVVDRIIEAMRES